MTSTARAVWGRHIFKLAARKTSPAASLLATGDSLFRRKPAVYVHDTLGFCARTVPRRTRLVPFADDHKRTPRCRFYEQEKIAHNEACTAEVGELLIILLMK